MLCVWLMLSCVTVFGCSAIVNLEEEGRNILVSDYPQCTAPCNPATLAQPLGHGPDWVSTAVPVSHTEKHSSMRNYSCTDGSTDCSTDSSTDSSTDRITDRSTDHIADCSTDRIMDRMGGAKGTDIPCMSCNT